MRKTLSIFAALTAASLTVMLAGCSKIDRQGTPLQKPQGAQQAGGEAATSAASETGKAQEPVGAPIADRPDCSLNREVRNPSEGAPEYVVTQLYAAALAPDVEESFQRFYSYFLPKHKESWVREQYWPRIRQHVHKYLTSEEPVVFRICREKETPDGGVKMFIRSNDPKKSDPPIALVKTGNGWRVDYFTY